MSAVIVAEPETGARGYLERQLADDGFEVLGAGEIPEVLDLAERLRPDLVVGTTSSSAGGCARASPAASGTATCR